MEVAVMPISRRALIGGGAALVGAGAVATFGERHTDELFAGELSAADLEALDIPVMLSVTDPTTGELEILVGEQAITFTDRSLVAKLARASRNGAV
jgi:3-hydroxyisobutyrate dehydrogenase-like beta-hydroxyacid dehydrogenase